MFKGGECRSQPSSYKGTVIKDQCMVNLTDIFLGCDKERTRIQSKKQPTQVEMKSIQVEKEPT